MKLTFCGAARAVTGSCIHVQLPRYQLLVDCGLQQGPDLVDNCTFPFSAKEIDAVLLTHCHADHCGRLPFLIQQGFTGPIWMTNPTAQLLEIMLQEQLLRQQHASHHHSGKQHKLPCINQHDVDATLQQIHICHYKQWKTLQKDIQFCFYDAGHILGSASIVLQYCEQKQVQQLLFSGDLGNQHMPMVENPQQTASAQTVIMESTHGDHCYFSQQDYLQPLANLLQQTFQKKGTVLIPAAAIGRTQELLYCLHIIKQKNLAPALPDFPVYVDSTLAYEACQIYNDNTLDEFLDEEARQLKNQCGALLDFPALHFCTTQQQSRQLWQNQQPKVLIAPDSMANSGPICSYLRQYLPRPQTTVVLLGIPRRNTVAHLLLEHTKQLTLQEQHIPVRAHIAALPVRPIHADQPALLHWLQQLPAKPCRVLLNHGDADTSLFLSALLQQYGYHTQVPRYGETISI